jgi:hypothetical protein
MAENIFAYIISDDAYEVDQWLQSGHDTNTQLACDSSPPILAFTPSLIAIAAFSGSFQVFKLLIRRKTNLQTTDTRRTPLEMFIVAGGTFPILKIFLQNSSFRNPLPSKNALHFAAEYGQLEMVKFLLERQYCSPNAADADGVLLSHP